MDSIFTVRKLFTTSIFLAFFSLILSDHMSAQCDEGECDEPVKVWEKTYEGSRGADELSWTLATNDGGFLLGGTLDKYDPTTEGYGNGDFLVVKIDSAGNQEWSQNFGGSQSDNLYCMTHSYDNGYVLAGLTSSNDHDLQGRNGSGYPDFWVLKLTADGTVDWQRTYGGSHFDQLNSIIQTSDSGYLLGGSTLSAEYSSTDNENFLVIKIDSLGSQMWARSYDTTIDSEFIKVDRLFNMISLSSKGFLLGGGSGVKGIDDYLVIEIDVFGNEVWRQIYGGSSKDYLTSMVSSPEGGYLLGGYSFSTDGDVGSNNGQDDFWIVKIAEDGNIEWEKSYGDTLGEELLSIAVSQDGGYFLVGDIHHEIGWLLKIDSEGEVQCDRKFSDYRSQTINHISIDSSGGFLLSGSLRNGGQWDSDFWATRFIMPAPNTEFQSYCPDIDGDGYGDSTSIAQYCVPPHGYINDCSDCDDNDSSVYPGAPGIDEDCQENPTSSHEVQNFSSYFLYPNPTFDKLNIGNYTKNLSYIIFDFTGKEVGHGSEENIDISHLSLGSFVLKIDVAGALSPQILKFNVTN